MRIRTLLGLVLLFSCLAIKTPLAASCKDSKKKVPSSAAHTVSKHAVSGPQVLANEIRKGQSLYKAYQCSTCHSIKGEGCKDGLPLDGVGSRRSEKFIYAHLKDPEAHFAKNSEQFESGSVNMMPLHDLEPAEIKLLSKFLKSLH